MPTITLIEKRGHETRRDIEEGLEKGKGRKKYNYIEISKIKTVKESVTVTPQQSLFSQQREIITTSQNTESSGLRGSQPNSYIYNTTLIPKAQATS